MENRILITCPKGIAPILKDEVHALGLPVSAEMAAGVETVGSMFDCMKLNLHIRTGHRVLFCIKEFSASTPQDFYQGIKRIRWEDLIPETEYVSVSSSVDNPYIQNTQFANQKCKDAIMDRMRENCGRRPDSGPDKTGVAVFVYWKGSNCSIYLDTSGEPLARRGYRKIPFKAPMQETLAAAVILSTGWRGKGNFLNPMCGSGTLGIEAAMIGLDKAPGLLRTNFAFMHLRDFRRAEWNALREEARKKSRKGLDGKMILTDLDPKAVRAAQQNALTAGVDHLMTFGVCDYSDTPVPAGGGIIVINPEYGERLGVVKELETVYEGMGNFFKRRCNGYRGYIFTGNPDLAKKVGLKTSRRLIFFNSRIECRLLEYKLYEGSRKVSQDQNKDDQ
jgi:putative N6-adenine-specific DNA methylase